jgi:GTPase SAR1 family protein
MEELHIDEGHAALDKIVRTCGNLKLSDANEAETRLKVIDEILKSVLGWRLEDISVEERCSEDGKTSFADYILRTATTAIVVEAKKVGATFELPSHRSAKLGGVLSEGQVGEAIRQVRDYARQKSIPFAIATNGNAWIIFPAIRTDQVAFEDTQAKVFRELSAIKEHLVEFWELLSRQRVIEGNLENLLFGIPREPNKRRLISLVSDYGYRLGRNVIFPLIEPAVAASFMDETLLNDAEGLEACYVKSSDRIKYDSRLQIYLADIKPPLDHRTTRVRLKKSSKYLDKQIESVTNIAPRFILILGPVGAGKTTFLHYTRKVSAVKLIEGKILWISIDFKKATISDNPRLFLYKEILSFVEKEENFQLGDWETSVQPAYGEMIENLQRGPLHLMAKADKIAFDKYVAETILKDHEAVEPYAVTIIKHATKTHPGFLVIDNVDQIEDDEFQRAIFVEAQAAARRMNLHSIMSLRESTYLRNRASPAFDAFQFDSVYIDPPQVLPVLSRRFLYAKRVLSGKSAEVTTETGLRLKVEDLSVFFEIVSRSLLQENTGFMLEMLSGGDIRRGLSLVREFLASAHTSADYALASYITDGQYQFPKHEVFRGAILGQRKYYREEESLIPNIFDSKLDVAHLQLLRLHTTHWFIAKAQFGFFEGAQVEMLLQDLHRVGVAESDVVRVLSELCDYRVLRTADGLPFSENSRLLPTRFAAYLLRELAASFAYFDLCVADSSIFDDSVWEDLCSITRQTETAPRYEKVRYRIDRARQFFNYLLSVEETWSVECRRRSLDETWSNLVLKNQIEASLEADFEKAQRSALRQESRSKAKGDVGRK